MAHADVSADGVEGLTTTVGPYRISWSRMAVAHSLIWSISELHTLASRGEDGSPRPPLATGPWVAAVIAGLWARSDAVAQLRQRNIELGALRQLDIRYLGPVHGEDLIYARCEVLSCTAGEDGRTGSLTVSDACFDGAQRALLACTRTYHCARTPA
jgi:acyl dehydratase